MTEEKPTEQGWIMRVYRHDATWQESAPMSAQAAGTAALVALKQPETRRIDLLAAEGEGQFIPQVQAVG
jgi:hypothetical protein